MFFSLLVGLLLQTAKADVQYVRTTYKFERGSPEEKLWRKCAEIPYSYMAELEGFRRISQEIQTLLHGPDYFARAGEVSQLREKLNVHSRRLIELARPEWNTEIYHIYLSWEFPEQFFFPRAEHDDRGWPVKYGEILEESVEKVMFFGERRPDLLSEFNFIVNRPRDLVVRIYKQATFIEYCQIVRTVELDYTVRFRRAIAKELPSTRIEYERKFKLIFEELP